MTHTSAGELDGFVPIINISEYLDFGFDDKVRYRDNIGLGAAKSGQWLGVAEKQGDLMCFYILNQNAEVTSRSRVQRVTSLELQTDKHSKHLKCLKMKSRSDSEIRNIHITVLNLTHQTWQNILNVMNTLIVSSTDCLLTRTLLRWMTTRRRSWTTHKLIWN